MTTALVTASDTARLATVAARYVRDTPAPDPASIMLLPGQRRIEIQPSVDFGDPVAILGALLIWTHRLTGITGEWWHTSGGRLHILLTGRGPCGIEFRIYSGIAYQAVRRHVVLAKGARESVTPDELYRLALELRKGQTK
ncbi:hypothetical protein G3I59_42895 [Amycolatopsis rubida]|uniref:Uncharacterized protein n=1 Tax=Amycolatopsis rubida TaxID=112413 RepID=A0ABX0C6A1_9PSEU|nr:MULTISPECIES: hypothetical protein [Amycolatopsis]MYW97189.1 hypothetical protein [Amycolatopsis rubida]NEC62174.1 hypothetical protein [Amycolatopsis rubida]OAP24623.1 hypothetical protein A4R44_04592 [Amycolatopsis sp. M39]